MPTSHETSPPVAVLMDMDGVLYHGDRALPHALDFVNALADVPHAFVTNNPIRSPTEIAARLEKMGFTRPEPRRIITSAEVTAEWLSRQKPDFRYFAVGARGLHDALAAFGTADSERADFVVVGEGAGLDFGSLTTGINLISKLGARLIATNPDESVDATDENGRHLILPGGGALVAPFAVATGTTPVFIGKPYPLIYHEALTRLGVAPEQCLMIGDRPDTDIQGAAALKMYTALVRTGRFADGDPLPEGCDAADWDTANLQQLRGELDRSYPGWLGAAG
jgi:NagD protein